MKLLNSNFIVLAAGSAIIAIFSLLFYFDVNRRIDAGEGRIIGTVTFKKLVAQRKYSRQVVWEDLEQTSPIYNNDTIRTGEQSEAMVKISDGTEFTMNENSMVLVSLGGDQLDLEFNSGSITANREGVTGDEVKKLNIKTGGATVTIDRSSVKLSTDKDSSLNLTVHKGDAVVMAGGLEQTVVADQKAVVMLKSAKVNVEDQSIVLLEPADNRIFMAPRNMEKVLFSWKPVETGGDVSLEVAPGKAFTGAVKKDKVSGTSASMELPGGSYVWRVSVRQRTGKTEYSDERRFSVAVREAVRLVAPEEGASFAYRSKPPIISFKWEKNGLASEYRLIIARDAEMKDVTNTIHTAETALATDILSGGPYFWKVIALGGMGGTGEAGASAVRRLTVLRHEEAQPPEPIYPQDKGRITGKLLELRPLEFSWRRNPEIIDTELIVAKDKSMKNIFMKTVKKSAYYKLDRDIPPGTYFWTVTGLLEDKTRTSPSRVMTFDVVKESAIELLSPADGETVIPQEIDGKPTVQFSWKRLDLEGPFIFQVAKDAEFKSVVVEKSHSGYLAKIPALTRGNYYWRVFLPDDDGSVFMKSRERQFSVEDRLSQPVLVAPSNGSTLDMTGKKSLTFSWAGPPEADAYRLELFLVRKGREYRIYDKVVRGNVHNLWELNRLDVSKFAWSLQAMSIEHDRVVRKSPVAKSYFALTLGKEMKKPVIRVPKIIVAE